MSKASFVLAASKAAQRVIEPLMIKRLMGPALLALTLMVSVTSKPAKGAIRNNRVEAVWSHVAASLTETPAIRKQFVNHMVPHISTVSAINAVGVLGVRFVYGLDMYRESGDRMHSVNELDAHQVAQPPVTYWSRSRISSYQFALLTLTSRQRDSYGAAPPIEEEIIMNSRNGNDDFLMSGNSECPSPLYESNSDDLLTWINRAAQSDQQARDLVMSNLGILRKISFICLKLHLSGLYQSRDKESKDLSQEVLMKILAGIGNAGEFENLKAFYGWVRKVARNVCYDAYRKDRHFLGKNVEDVFENPDSFSCNSNYEDRVLLMEAMATVRALPPIAQEIFSLHFEEGYRINEIKGILGCSRPTIYRHLVSIQEILAPFRSQDE